MRHDLESGREQGAPADRDDESKRLAALRSFDILDTPPEAVYDQITATLARVLRVPVALVTFIDEHRQWFKSAIGIGVRETPREIAFCAHTIETSAGMVVEDAAQDPRFAENPMVTGPPGVRFYAGVPLRSAENLAVGTLCVVDVEPRDIGERELELMRYLARQVEAQLELRRKLSQLFPRRSPPREANRAPQPGPNDGWSARFVDELQCRLVCPDPQLAAALHVPEDRFLREPWSALEELVHPDDRAVFALLGQPGDLPGRHAFRLRGFDGRYRWLGLTMGQRSAVRAQVFEDDAATGEELLAESRSALARALGDLRQSRTEELATVVHDLRSPLNAVIGALGLLRSDLTVEPAELSRIALSSARILDSRIRGLLDLYLYERGQLEARRAPIDAAALLSEVRDRMRWHLGDLERFVTEVERERFLADRDLILRILENLVANAARHAPAGSPVVARIGTDEAGTPFVEITDEGPGIPDEQRSAVTSAGTTSGGLGHYGLGLAFCAAAAQAHGGELEIGSGNKGGARIRVTLPEDTRAAPQS